jgi:hypothetical protein
MFVILTTLTQYNTQTTLEETTPIVIFEVRHPHCVSNKSNYKVYVYIVKHNYILGVSARSRTYTCPLHPINPLQMHIYLTDKFSLYNLKTANI